ncbi:amidase [Sodalis sp. dw_96]|uniref:amidase n=1 Tax=Sodalis sp. dw_96 TaxID=2719794 RepID=UPI001BD33EAF|nr:amidase [Sodalis sp. dw_96]
MKNNAATSITPPPSAAGLSVVEALNAMSHGTLTSEALVSACLERIERRDGDVRAWAYLDREQALAQARQADRSAANGLLHGIPVGVKDIIDVGGMRTGFNSPAYPHYFPAMDAGSVALIRNAGGIILGKTVTTEFANREPGPTMNPHDGRRTPGGSSSGSAAAVADYQVPLALGTQTSGSVIRPAGYCGIVGYKPTFGEFTRVGVKQQSGSLDTLGLCARNVRDAELLRTVIIGTDYRPVPMPEGPLRIAFCRPPEWEQADPAVRRRAEECAALLAKAGHHLSEPALPECFNGWLRLHSTIANFESARNLAFEKTAHRQQLSAKLYQGRIRDGENITLEQYIAAQREAETLRATIHQYLEGIDIILTLSTANEAPIGLDDTGSAVFNSLWTLLYTPCLTLPAGVGPSGLPLGIQLVGRRFKDEALFAAALAVEAQITEG